jgi:hypothetical protein
LQVIVAPLGALTVLTGRLRVLIVLALASETGAQSRGRLRAIVATVKEAI